MAVTLAPTVMGGREGGEGEREGERGGREGAREGEGDKVRDRVNRSCESIHKVFVIRTHPSGLENHSSLQTTFLKKTQPSQIAR